MNDKKFKFIDLFAGIGGFHQAMEKLGGECVCASEIDENCQFTYKLNFPDTPIVGDINEYYDKMPQFDVLCGGFPCQPFSKAGKQEGFEDKTRGNLFYKIMEILKLHPECKFVILENVKNLADNIENWNIIQEKLREQNFYITEKPIILSPHQFGIPQIRERVYILGIRKDIRDSKKLPNGCIHLEDLGELFNFDDICKEGDAYKVLEKNVSDDYYISKKENEILEMWLEFKRITNYESIGVPVWVEYFGYNLSDEEYGRFIDHTGKKISEMPRWKKRFVEKNRKFYIKYKNQINKWIEKYNVLSLPLGMKKLEWNCGLNKDLKQTIIQFRQSGVRIKKNNYFPALVAINNTPIIFDIEKNNYRRITPREAANLQSFNKNFILDNNQFIYKQLGNAVNVEIIKILAERLFLLSINGNENKN